MAKKVQAPKTYNPGKGRPKEHLAYLNEREMAYLRMLNGGNMERGPRGLPSFAEDRPAGPGGPNGPNSGPSSSLGGGGKGTSGPAGGGGPGGPSGPNSSPSRASTTASTPTQTSTPAPKTPTSPMSGQGTSFRSPMGASWANRDAIDRQKVQVNDARSAIQSTPAARTDLAVGGIRTLNVGPMGTSVNVGKAPPTKQFYDRVPEARGPKSMGPLGAGYDERVPSVQPGMKYSSPLTPGMTPEDMARRGALMDQYEREIRNIMRGDPVRTGDPISAGGGPTVGKTQGLSPPGAGYSGGMFNQENEIQQAAVDRAISQSIAERELKARPSVSGVGIGSIISSPAAAATPGSVDLRGAGYGTFNVPDVDFENRFREAMTPTREIEAPPSPFDDERILEVENYPERPDYTAGTYFSPEKIPAKPSYNQRAIDRQYQYMGLDEAPYREPSEKTLDRLNEVFAENGLRPAGKTRGLSPGDFKNAATSGVESSGEVLGEDGYGYPTKPDGSPITAEDIANMPPEIQREYFEKVRHARRQDTPYPLTSAQKTKGYVAGIVTAPVRRGPVGALLKGASYLPGPIGEAAEDLSNPRAAVNEYDRLNPLRKQQVAERAGKRPGYGGSTVTTSVGGETSDIGTGGKAEPERPLPKVRSASKAVETGESGPRPEIYYMWDLGMRIPSPTDSDYTLYLKYLDEKKAAQA